MVHSFLPLIVFSQCIAFSCHRESDGSISEEFKSGHEPKSTNEHFLGISILILSKSILLKDNLFLLLIEYKILQFYEFKLLF